MRRLAMTAMLMATTLCFASDRTYDLSLDLSVDGKHIASPRIVVAEGVKSSIQIDGKFIDVVARGTGRDQIDMSFWIGEVNGGLRTVAATPAVVAHEGQPAELRMSVQDPGVAMKELTLTVIAHSRVE